MNLSLRICLVTTLLLAALPSARAADNGFYLGAGVGRSNIQVDEAALEFDGDDTAFKILAGLRPLDWLGVEVNYVDLGNPDDTVAGVTVESDTKGFSAFVMGFLPAGPVDVFAKAGLINWDASISSPSLPALSSDDDGTDFAYGAGLQFRVWSLSLRGEYEKFDIDDLDDANLLSLSVTWTFL